MEKQLAASALFSGMTPQETAEVLRCLGAERRVFQKGEMICRAGEAAAALGVVLSGRVLIGRDDFWGNTTVLDSVGPGQIFAEAYACTPGEPLMVNVAAAEAAEVLLLPAERMLTPCAAGCPHHGKLLRNLLALTARKNLGLSRKIFYTAAKSIRGRLLSYLSDQALRTGSRSFTIPFNRQQLADYLNVDRSALSSELGRMRREGLLLAEKNRFTLLDAGAPAR